jgi:hypothetical protein
MRQKKVEDKLYNDIISGMKMRLDNGEKLEDLDFRVFRDRADEMWRFLKRYVDIKNRRGIDL